MVLVGPAGAGQRARRRGHRPVARAARRLRGRGQPRHHGLRRVGGTVFFHHVGHGADARAGVMAFVIAMVSTALIGAVVALPALRLRGLYLALATAAFSLGVEQMVFKELSATAPHPTASSSCCSPWRAWWRCAGRSGPGAPRARVSRCWSSAGVIVLAATNPWLRDEEWSAIFPNGNLQVPRPHLLRHRLRPAVELRACCSPSCWRCSGVLLIVLRRSAYGRRLTAMKNSPAACATLGLEHRAAEALGVHAVGGDRGARRLPVRGAGRGGHGRSVQPLRVDGAAHAAGGGRRGLRVRRDHGRAAVRGGVRRARQRADQARPGPRRARRSRSAGWRSSPWCCRRSSASGSGATRAGSSTTCSAASARCMRDTPQVFVRRPGGRASARGSSRSRT